MDLIEAIRRRRSIRVYKEDAVAWDHVVQILDAAKYTPFAGNILNSKFLVVKSDGKRNALAEASMQQHWMAVAPVHIVVVAEPEKAERYYGTRGARLYTLQSAGAAIQTMMLVAHSLGLGSCWVGAFDEDEVRAILGLPEHVHVQGIVTFGYPAEDPDMPPKYRIEHIMFFEKWWGRIQSPNTGLGYWSPAVEYATEGAKEAVSKGAKKLVDGIKEGVSKIKKATSKKKKTSESSDDDDSENV